MTNSLDLPFHLYQVLEEEYLSLHGGLRREQKVWLHKRTVTAALDWRFYEGHVHDDVRMHSLLLTGRAEPSAGAGRDLKAHFEKCLQARLAELRPLAAKADAEAGATASPPAGGDPAAEARSERARQLREKVVLLESALRFFASAAVGVGGVGATDAGVPVEDVLNALLETRLYDAERFRHVKFGETTQKLIGLYESYTATEAELPQFNRLLFEDLYPEELARVADVRLAAIFQRLHGKDQAALCLSGGGIRSGTFALGIMQGFARRNLLSRFDYLSTVSGGGYIGSWLTAWAHRHRDGLGGVVKELTNRDPQSKVDPDPPPINYLRAYSSFLTPRAGLFTADTWAFIAIYIRNLLLNWLVLFPLVLAFLLLPRLYVALLQLDPRGKLVEGWQVAAPMLDKKVDPGVRHLFFVLGTLLVVWAVAYTGLNRPGFREQFRDYYPRLARRSTQRGFLVFCLLPLVAAAVLLTTYWAWTGNEDKKFLVFAAYGVGVPLLGGLLSRVMLWRRPSVGEVLAVAVAGAVGGVLVGATAFADKPKGTDLLGLSVEFYACLAVPMFLLLFLLATTLFIGLSSHTRAFNDEDREWWARFGAWLLIVAMGWVVFTALVIFGPLVFFEFPRISAALGGLSGIVAAVVARSAKTPGSKDDEAQGGFMSLVSGHLLPLLALVFALFFGAAMSLATDVIIQRGAVAAHAASIPKQAGGAAAAAPTGGAASPTPTPSRFQQFLKEQTVARPGDGGVQKFYPDLETFAARVGGPLTRDTHFWLVHYPSTLFIFLLTAALSAFGLVLARSINLNLFSLHGGYRNRLIRGFLGASRGGGTRSPNPFTGFDPLDNVYMHELRPALLREVDFCDLRALAADLYAARPDAPPPGGDPSPAAAPLAYLYGHLSPTTHDALSRADLNSPLAQQTKVDLIEDLNRILEEQRLDREPAFAASAAAWRAERERIRHTPEADRDYPVHRNRFILDRALEPRIRRCKYPPHRLFHVINTSLNLVGGDNLAWQQRKAESFTVSPLHSGSYRVGYRRSKDYGGPDGISLGTAVAVSGAAASSNMGYYTTSPVLSLVMTLFNVRLGWWLGNPGPRGSETYLPLTLREREAVPPRLYRRASPTLSVFPVLAEAFGLTNDRSQYVYLTDGGHFENLALYEMVLRRCRLIVVADGAADPNYEFGDLGSAVRKIRIDFGIPIDFIDVPIYKKPPEKEGEGGSYWAIGRIRYSEVDRVMNSNGKNEPARDGLLIYVKPAVYGDEPEDVLNYQRSFADFPHETTADQFFDEPQFESHRILGSHIADLMCHEMGEAPTTSPPSEESDEAAKSRFARSAFAELKSAAPQLQRSHYWQDFEKWFNEQYPAPPDTCVREIGEPITDA